MNLRARSLITYLLDRLVNRHPRFRKLLLKSFFPDRDIDIDLFGERLRNTLAGKNVNIFGCALSDRSGELEFGESAESSTFGVKDSGNPFLMKGHTLRVDAATLDSLLIEGDSIVLKIDV